MPKSRLIALLGRVALVLAGTITSARAEEWDLCPPQPPLPEPRIEGRGDPNATDAIADTITSEGSIHILTGNVELLRGDRRVGADRIEIDRAGREAQAEGNVYLRTPESVIYGPRGEIDTDTGAFEMPEPRFMYPGEHAQGGARRAERDDAGVTVLSEATWSTCPREAEAWNLSADSIRLNPNNRQGTARNASLWFQGVPLLYTPWFRFPLGDERLSGFLAPTIGSNGDSGTIVSVPWYWNIAPNFDMTLTPRFLSERGGQLETETRWLGPLGSVQLDLHYLPDDDEFGDDRTLSRLMQKGRFGNGVRTDIDIAGVSDDDYFEDLGDRLSVTSRDFLESRADIFWNSAYGSSRLRLQSFQTLDDDIAIQDRPHKQLPQFTHRYGHDGQRLDVDFRGELVDFERDDRDTATRLRLVPAVTREFSTPGWFLQPRLALDHTSYDIDRETSTGPDRIDRTLPVLSLDGGLVFERFGNNTYQTLEPRLFYVYIPEDDQDDIPVFDSDDLTFNFSRLFRERRFSGGDRIGDTNRLSLALTSRLVHTGREVARGSVGVIQHFDDREVTLPGVTEDTDDLSDVVAEIAVRPNPRWRARTTAQWNPNEDETSRHDTRIAFRGDGGGIANFDYRFQRGRREQTDISFAWPISPRWTLLARNTYSLREDRRVENLLGLEYEDCCWRLRTVAREFIEDDDNDGVESDHSIMIELVLKGLGGLGDPAGETFEDAILGFQDPGDPDN